MQVQINGERREISDRFTLEELVRELSLPPQRIAIELNRNVVRRNEWRETILNDGDRIEIVHFVGGGTTVGSKQKADAGRSEKLADQTRLHLSANSGVEFY